MKNTMLGNNIRMEITVPTNENSMCLDDTFCLLGPWRRAAPTPPQAVVGNVAFVAVTPLAWLDPAITYKVVAELGDGKIEVNQYERVGRRIRSRFIV